MLLLEVANDVYSKDEGGVVKSICPSPLNGALAFDLLYTELIKPTTSESHLPPNSNLSSVI